MSNLSDEDISKIASQLLQNKNFVNSLSRSSAYFLKDDKIFEATKKKILADAREEVQKEVDDRIKEIKEYVACKIENWTHDYLLKDFDGKLGDASNSSKSEFSKMISEQVIKNLELPKIVIDLSKGCSYIDYDKED